MVYLSNYWKLLQLRKQTIFGKQGYNLIALTYKCTKSKIHK